MPAAPWPDETSLPPLRQRDGTPMPPADISNVLQLLRSLPEPARCTMEHPHPLQPWRRFALPPDMRARLDALRERCGEQAINDWMAALLRFWLQDIGTGTARKYPWVVPAAGVLGGDGCAALLGAHLRGENHSLRCTGEVGVEALVDRCCRHCEAIVDGIGALPGAEIVARPVLNQGLLRFVRAGNTPVEDDAFTEWVIGRINATGEAFFSGTVWRGRRVMRVSVVNWRTGERDVARAIEAARTVLAEEFAEAV